ncbi:MAG: 3,4-dihydroxy-2-butanone-4-phosphate synthase [Pirellulaceae bacterium]
MRRLACDTTTADDFVRPGPSIAARYGRWRVARAGHTEAAVDFTAHGGAQAAGVLTKSWMIAATVLTRDDLMRITARHNLEISPSEN